MLIRPATTRDARPIARVQVRGWQVGYRGIVPDAYLAQLTVEDRSNHWLAYQASPQRMEHLVAEDGEEAVVGWAAFGANQSDLDAGTGELGALYVDPVHWNRGVGGALLWEAEAGLAAAGYERAVLWTLAANDRTRRFYEHRGWHFDGVTAPHGSGADVVRYAKDLGARVDPSAAGAYDSGDEQA